MVVMKASTYSQVEDDIGIGVVTVRPFATRNSCGFLTLEKHVYLSVKGRGSYTLIRNN